jgi:outer membrane receptor for ferrienterochelin and colicin
VKPYNVGSARIAGAELQVVVPLPSGLLAQAAYSWLDAVNLRPGDQQDHPLAYRPPHRLFLRLARRGPRFEGYGECSYTSALPRNAFGSAYEDAQLVLSAGAGVRVSGPLWLNVEVRNLLDDQTLEDLFQYPLPGRSISLIARARL